MADACSTVIPFAGSEILRVWGQTVCGLKTGGSYVNLGPDSIQSIEISEEIDAPDDRERVGMNGILQGSIVRRISSKYRNITIVANGRIPALDNLLRGARLTLNASGVPTGAGVGSATNSAARAGVEIWAPLDLEACTTSEDLVFLFPTTAGWKETDSTSFNGDVSTTTYEGRGYANTSFDFPFGTAATGGMYWTTTDPTGTATQNYVNTENFAYNRFASASRPAVQCTLTTTP
jgi:hypothetical protein